MKLSKVKEDLQATLEFFDCDNLRDQYQALISEIRAAIKDIEEKSDKPEGMALVDPNAK